jgi:hypothetical protein
MKGTENENVGIYIFDKVRLHKKHWVPLTMVRGEKEFSTHQAGGDTLVRIEKYTANWIWQC